MSSNNIDKHIAEKLKNRELKPSNSAWERLETRLDNQEATKKRNWFLYIGYAAGLALLISFVALYFTGSDSKTLIEEVIVNTSIDTLKINNKGIEKFIKNTDEAVVELEEKKQEKQIRKKKKITVIRSSTLREEEKVFKNIQNQELPREEEVVAKMDKPIVTKKKEFNSRVKVNSDDLLFSVTHTPNEVKEYYAKHKLKREDVLKAIEDELKESNLKIDPSIILAEVERTIDDEEFKGDFMQKLKSRISDIAVAIVDRNK
ncbi:hypothetical protein MHM83_10175 [Tenacibaculum sp. Mcav3-52]|uniref:Anti-sigma factor n=1 Tax=Tenacibaculum sp. Pbs-1 TaxID=3238748 RepID=A0AB33KZD0_9FLAO|nr:hypothetical protein [Tenacibaculum sp. Mcav3-52]MCG7502237.1 hypothetical protein [Tenacibaculum sp. Mcav3-52]BFF40955.1 hypothetical protein BACY1_27600 [Tenacibaculum mesophilum]GFD76373.1 hypothetical protein KUL113_57930 [Tenacibaculum sp. KUL113]|eukprot:TRINITY_DN100_c0_g1_i1.p2 TRINITY_DN100_c0_g1~~TRINITY_DN100_c0_g1_i1.p2  ORF type:complete len:260 (+),score=63.34 TRINITY_DN100_c0_g1_i1:924-1703(+)